MTVASIDPNRGSSVFNSCHFFGSSYAFRVNLESDDEFAAEHRQSLPDSWAAVDYTIEIEGIFLFGPFPQVRKNIVFTASFRTGQYTSTHKNR